MSAWIGTYIWGGVLADADPVNGFYRTVDLMLRQGFDTIRIAPGSTAIDGYTLSPQGGDTLTGYAQVLFNSPVWDNPGLKRIMITAIDRTLFNLAPGNNAFMTDATLTANKAAVKAEYAALFAYLNTRFAGRGIQFILSNWEADNFVYGGSVYRFSLDPAWAAGVIAGWPSGQTNQSRLAALLKWFSFKDEAVAEFVAANPSVSLIHAPEFSQYALFANPINGTNGQPYYTPNDSVLAAIKAAGGRTYASFSSYESQGGAQGYILNDIKSSIPNLILGECGRDLAIFTPKQAFDNFAILAQVRQQPGILGIIPWNAASAVSSTEDYGFFDRTGAQHAIKYMGSLRPVAQAPSFRA